MRWNSTNSYTLLYLFLLWREVSSQTIITSARSYCYHASLFVVRLFITLVSIFRTLQLWRFSWNFTSLSDFILNFWQVKVRGQNRRRPTENPRIGWDRLWFKISYLQKIWQCDIYWAILAWNTTFGKIQDGGFAVVYDLWVVSSLFLFSQSCCYRRWQLTTGMQTRLLADAAWWRRCVVFYQSRRKNPPYPPAGGGLALLRGLMLRIEKKNL